ncbi:MAG: DUF4249 family protein [Bacteroidota bacterium]
MRNQLTLLFLTLLLASACDEDSFSQVVDIPLPDHDPLPALSLFLQARDTVAYPLLGISRGILEEPDFSTYREGIIELYRNDVLIARDTQNANASFSFRRELLPLATPVSTEAATFRLVGLVEGFEPVEAIQEMPAPPVIDAIEYEEDGAIDQEGFRVDELNFDIIDPPGETNYYAFRVGVATRDCEYFADRDTVICAVDPSGQITRSYFLQSPDPLLQGGLSDDLLISDQSFDGQRYRIRLLVESFRDEPPILEVQQLTEDAYRYGISYAAYLEAGDNPFAEPVQVHANVEGGYGAFVVANKILRQLTE